MGQQIEVYADKAGGSQTVNKNVTFFVYVPNSAPYINIDSEVYLCEDSALHKYFNVSDDDEDVYNSDFLVDNNPKNIFHLSPFLDVNYTTITWELFSSNLTKSFVGKYSQTIGATDGVYSDSRQVNITVIEINHAPVVENIGVQTVWTRGDNVFYKKLNASDIEDGDQDSGNLLFNLTFQNSVNLFNISSRGVINFSANESQLGVYNVSLCVGDRGLQSISSNISLCNQTGLPITVCQNFSLTVTDVNRPPTITSYYPLNLTFSALGTDLLYFNITKYDPDGTVPDSYWYVDNVLVQYNSGNNSDELRYRLGCGVSGNHRVRVDITDGLLNDSIEWGPNIAYVNCPALSPSSGGGGGGSECSPNLVCTNWNVCQNTEKSKVSGLLVGEDYRNIKRACDDNSWTNETCGIQTRGCKT